MRVFKFGGGILHSAGAIKKLPGIIKLFPETELIIVISAFGKITNALEELIGSVYRQESQRESILADILEYGCPAAWQKKMISHGFDPVEQERPIESLVKFCKCIEAVETMELQLNPNSKSAGKTKQQTTNKRSKKGQELAKLIREQVRIVGILNEKGSIIVKRYECIDNDMIKTKGVRKCSI